MSERDPTPTRRRLLEVGQQEIYLHGFQGASLAKILKRTGVTKGAFFHHFSSKATFGYSVVEEVIAEMIDAQWVRPLRGSGDPLETIAAEFERGARALARQRPILGCPLNNLAQEMNPLDDGFRSRTLAVFTTWHDAYAAAIERAKSDDTVKQEVARAAFAAT
jgi:TetR/AcrR family transcriptional repressor of nem operon